MSAVPGTRRERRAERFAAGLVVIALAGLALSPVLLSLGGIRAEVAGAEGEFLADLGVELLRLAPNAALSAAIALAAMICQVAVGASFAFGLLLVSPGVRRQLVLVPVVLIVIPELIVTTPLFGLIRNKPGELLEAQTLWLLDLARYGLPAFAGFWLGAAIAAVPLRRLRRFGVPNRDLVVAGVLGAVTVLGTMLLLDGSGLGAAPGEGWLGRLEALIFPFSFSAVIILLFYQAFNDVPRAYWQIASMDSESAVGFFLRVLLPTTQGTMRLAAFLTFFWSWSAFYWPSIVLITQGFNAESVAGSPLSLTIDEQEGDRHRLALQQAIALIAMLPPLVAFLLLVGLRPMRVGGGPVR